MRRSLIAIAFALAAATPGALTAHAVVYPKRSDAGAYERYVLRVPNEKDRATTRIEIHFPADARVISFSDVAGWQLQTLTDSAGRIVGAVWTGTLPPERFVELPFIAVNPKSGTLVWPVIQTYEGNEVVRWVGPEGSEQPASATTIASGTGGKMPLVLSSAALLLALISLGIVLGRKELAHNVEQP